MNLKKTQSNAKKLSGHLLDLLFSEGTYQLKIYDSSLKKDVWPFLHIDDFGNILDSFCTCDDVSCFHLTAAYQAIFSKEKGALHVRFRKSFWNKLFHLVTRRHGYDKDELRKEKKGFFIESIHQKRLFSIQALNKEGERVLEEIIIKKPAETEETSLKFSHLPAEELALWKEGRPSHYLSFELSFWSDLAKWCFLSQEKGENYQIKIEPLNPFPHKIEIKFKELSLFFYIAKVNWPEIIPSLLTVKSPLPVHQFQQKLVKKITYSAQEKTLYVDSDAFFTSDLTQGVPFGDWVYLPHQGFFFTLLDPLLNEKKISEENIPLFFKRHQTLIEKTLPQLHSEPIPAGYTLFFDEKETLHLSCYVFEPGDLDAPLSAFFGPWVYLEKKGFFYLTDLLFEKKEESIEREHLSHFIEHHKEWLSHKKGFEVHRNSLHPHYDFTVTQTSLIFNALFEERQTKKKLIDCGEWIFLQDLGFYPKKRIRPPFFGESQIVIKKEDVPAFIRSYAEELQEIPGFFRVGSPIQQMGLALELTNKEEIQIKPSFKLKEEMKDAPVHFFEDFGYSAKEGFFEIPQIQNLPEKYFHECVISNEETPYFLGYELDSLKPFILSIDPRLTPAEKLTLTIERLEIEETFWVLEGMYTSSKGALSLFTLWQALQEKKRVLFTEIGRVSLFDSRFYWLKALAKNRFSADGKEVRLSSLEWLRLISFEQIETKSAQAARLLEAFQTYETELFLDLKGLKSTLRPYQQMGVKWLWFLYCFGLSGILADEMGLGKTHQAMALISAIFNAKGEGLVLIVCPTSVLYHWEDLLQKFLPHLKVFLFYGPQRTLPEENFDILLTSYGTLRAEQSALSQFAFELFVLDEAHVAKNSQSQIHAAVKKIRTKMRLALTGTPIENRLLELKALLDIVIPKYLPPDPLFKEQFLNPIEKFNDVSKKEQLTRLIKPFILRRKKEEVLKDLPAKIEEVRFCVLSSEQQTLYKKVFLTSKEKILKEMESKEIPYLHVFALFSTLKQIANHPALFYKDIKKYHKHHSGKWELFKELLHEARESGQKVVVFSQYLNMLAIIELYLEEKGIGFASIKGHTKDRKGELTRFKEDPKCEVFVASLLAAGVGIDLVSASVVIHYDRWWNPAKENQATDRVHRIGQRRGVQVFKLVAKETIEEHIHEMLIRKSSLMGEIIGYDDEQSLKKLTRVDLLHLFDLIHQDV